MECKDKVWYLRWNIPMSRSVHTSNPEPIQRINIPIVSYDDFTTNVKELNRVNLEDENVNQQSALSEKTKDQVYCQLKQLESSFNPEVS